MSTGMTFTGTNGKHEYVLDTGRQRLKLRKRPISTHKKNRHDQIHLLDQVLFGRSHLTRDINKCIQFVSGSQCFNNTLICVEYEMIQYSYISTRSSAKCDTHVVQHAVGR